MISNRADEIKDEGKQEGVKSIKGGTKNIFNTLIELQKLEGNLIRRRDELIVTAVKLQDSIEHHNINKLINALNEDGENGWEICREDGQGDAELAELEQLSKKVDLVFQDVQDQIEKINEIMKKNAQRYDELKAIEKVNTNKTEIAAGKRSQSKLFENITRGAYNSLFTTVLFQLDSTTNEVRSKSYTHMQGGHNKL